MRKRIFFFLFLFIFALLVQSITPTLNLDVNMVELIETSEELKKTPPIKETCKTIGSLNLLDIPSSKRFLVINDNICFNNPLEVIVPPPRA